MRDQEPPNCPRVEQCIIGCMFDYGEDNIAEVVSFLGEDGESLYIDVHRKWYRLIVGMWRSGDIVRIDTIIPKAESTGAYEKIGGFSMVAQFAEAATIQPYIETHCKMILECYARRRLISACHTAKNALYDMEMPLIDIRRDIETAAFHGQSQKTTSKPESVSSLVVMESERLASVGRREIGKGIKTGLGNIDEIMLPMQPGNYIIVAARTSLGKTTLSCNIALNAAIEGVGVLIFSLEMTKQSIVNKLLQIDSGVDMSQIEREHYVTDDQQKRIAFSVEKFKNLNIVIDDDSDLTPTQLRSKARAVCAKTSIGLIVVDYVGLILVPKEKDPVVAVTIASREMKAMAKELGVPVLVLSQINREGAKDRPDLHHLRQSGSLEQDCDVAIILDMPNKKEYPSHITAIVAKQRNGPCGDAALIFNKSEQKFYDADISSGKPMLRPEKNYTRNFDVDLEPENYAIEYGYLEEDEELF